MIKLLFLLTVTGSIWVTETVLTGTIITATVPAKDQAMVKEKAMEEETGIAITEVMDTVMVMVMVMAEVIVTGIMTLKIKAGIARG